MKVAWFAPRDASRNVDAAVAALGDQHSDARVDVFDRSDAHDFVWKHLQQPYDLCVYELADETRYAFVAGYLFHYPGLLVLHELVDAHDAIRASKVVVTAPASVAPLQQDYPAIRIRPLPLGAPAIESHRTGGGEVRFAVLDRDAVPLAELAMARARAAGASAVLMTPAAAHHGPRRTSGEGPRRIDLERLVADADVVIALRWPAPGAALPDTIYGMSAGKPVIVFETEATADWPALDPQTWQPRGFEAHARPIVVSIDPRDEEHSLMLAIRRLSADAALREIGRAHV